MQMQNFRFARQEIITNAQTFHRVEDLLDVSRGYIISQLGNRIASCFDGMQDFDAQLKSIRIWLTCAAAFPIEGANPRVEVPAVIIKRESRGKGTVKRLDVGEHQPFDVHKANHDISDLDSRVVNVVLDFDAISRRLKYPYKRIAEHSIAHVPDVRSLVGVDAGMLDHQFSRLDRWLDCRLRL